MKTAFRLISFLMLAGLWAVAGADMRPVEADEPSPKAVPPECQAAESLVNLAAADVKDALKTLDQTLEKTKQMLAEQRHAVDSFQETRGTPGPADRLKRANAALKQAEDHARSARERLSQAARVYLKRLDEAEVRCGSRR